MMKDMSPKGKVVNTAWLVCATAALGDHLGFTAGVVPEMITPVVIGKLVGGVLAIALAILMTKDLTLEEEQSIKMKKDAV
ncbi:ethanolamine utilization protein EutH [Clostridioides difficile]